MKVSEIMTTNVSSCSPDWDLSAVAELMWDADCGVVPVVDGRAKVVGVITDRDICMAAATKDRPARHISAREVMSGHILGCFPDDELSTALGAMSQAKIRRLPVLDREGVLKGMVSMNDLILAAGGTRAGITSQNILAALQSICEHRTLPQPVG